MAPAMASITISAGLIEKLAGMRKPPPRKAAHAGVPFTLPSPQRMPGLSAEAADAVAKDARLSRALTSTTQIGGLLLNQEEAETRKVNQLADELLAKHRTSPPLPACQAQRDACVDCYKLYPQDALRCASVVEAYTMCAQRSFEQRAR